MEKYLTVTGGSAAYYSDGKAIKLGKGSGNTKDNTIITFKFDGATLDHAIVYAQKYTSDNSFLNGTIELTSEFVGYEVAATDNALSLWSEATSK